MADTIIRCEEHSKNFTIIDNTCMKTATLSMQAMGLFAYLMTLPNNWTIRKTELVNHFSNGRDAVYKAFNELIDAGFITFAEVKTENGQFESYIYYIHERPVPADKISIRKEFKKKGSDNSDNGSSKDSKSDNGKPENSKSVNGNPYTENPYPGNPYTENPSLPSTNKLSTDKPSTHYSSRSGTARTESSKKSKTKAFDEYLNSISDDDKTNAELLTQYMFDSFRETDPKYNRRAEQLLEWQVEFAKFLVESQRSIQEVIATLRYGFKSDYWSQYIFNPKSFIKNYEKLLRQSVNHTRWENEQTNKSEFTDGWTPEKKRALNQKISLARIAFTEKGGWAK